ncbi:organomercurial lyase [Actinophytocola sp.]|uniref:organomercurial lyase n=1 Tax=Actinophytocola sp. TaxID=1872138 RepID=UPI0025BAB5FB|nr:organomercurial lyase [Actinophytocola sp.]
MTETRALTGSLGDLVRLGDEVVHLVIGTSSPPPRFQVRIDDRTIKAGGCAPDLFWIAVCTQKSVYVDTACRATGTPIRVTLGPAGVAAVEPDTTVVAVVHPGMQPELMDTIDATIHNTTGPDEDFCYHQPFFAAHPGGRVFPVADFLEFWRRLTRETLAKANVDIL